MFQHAKQKPFKRAKLLCLFGLVVLFISGCSFGNGGLPDDGDVVYLTLHGYNYTDHTIPDYWVNGASGVGIRVSSPTTGGSGGACCVRWRIGQKLPVKVHIKWASSVCTYYKTVDGEQFPRAKVFYSERDVWLKGPVPKDPKYFETHFYPDGHIEVAITDHYSLPRLKLPEKNNRRPGAKPWPKCTPEQLKQKD